MNEQAKTKLTKARIALIVKQPFYGTLALRLRLVEMPSIPTLAVDGVSVFYNPEFILGLSDSLCESAVAHEVGHCVFDHITRRGDRHPVKWNQAGDFVINGMLKNAGFEIGDGWLINSSFDGMTSDHVYSLLPDPPDDGGKGGGNGGALCDILPAPGDGNNTANEQMRDEWTLATIQAATVAKQAGKLPADMERFIHDLVHPKADWRALLRRFVTEVNQDDYNWARPNKRYIHAGFYLPTLYDEGLGHMVVAVDTSGSIDQRTLDCFAAEIKAIRSTTNPKLTTIIYCDSRINHVDEFKSEDILEMKLHGGGGTDFCPPFEYVEEHGISPACFVYLTDLYGSAPPVQPHYPCMWVSTTNAEHPWGERVDIEVS